MAVVVIGRDGVRRVVHVGHDVLFWVLAGSFDGALCSLGDSVLFEVSRWRGHIPMRSRKGLFPWQLGLMGTWFKSRNQKLWRKGS